MSFKRLFAAACLILALAGCSVNEGPAPARKKDFAQGSLGCMKNFNANLVQYFGGKATPSDVNRVADCAIAALRTFGELVRGENRDRFTAQEVKNFLQTYFLNDVVISDSFLKELMRVKQALVGGKTTDFTPNDLKEAEVLINVFREILLKLQPVTPLSLERVRTGSVEFAETEARAIAEVGDIFGQRITQKDSTYSFDEMSRLVDEIIKAFPGSAGTLDGIRDHLKNAGIFKQLLISPNRPRGEVTANEWRLIFQDGSQWLGAYLKFLNLNGKYPDWTRGEGRARFSVVLGESLDLFDQVIQRHCPIADLTKAGVCTIAPGIPFSLINEVLDSLDWDGTIAGVKFHKSSIEAVIKPLFQHFFGGIDQTATGRSATRITSVHLGRFRALIREWIDGSRYVEGLYSKILRSPEFKNDAMISTPSILMTDVREVLRENGGVTEEAIAVADGLRGTFGRSVALKSKNSRGMLFDGKNKTRARVYRELTLYTWMKPLMKLAVLGYMAKPTPARAAKVESDGLNVVELEDLFSGYYKILKDLKLVGPRNTPHSDAASRFREASIFTWVSDGNLLFSIEEGMQLVQYMLVGNPMGTDLHNRAARLCPTGPLDDYGERTIEPNCYRAKMYDFRSTNQDMADLWAPFPILMNFYDHLDDGDQEDFRAYVEIASRKVGYTPATYFSSSESSTTPMIFHYIEELFLRFDTNGDGFIDKKEAALAFPMFQTTLAPLANMAPTDPKLLSVFYYLLSHGGPPTDSTMSHLSWFWHTAEFLWFHLRQPDFTSNRLNLLQVFATISISTSTPAPTPSPSPNVLDSRRTSR